MSNSDRTYINSIRALPPTWKPFLDAAGVGYLIHARYPKGTAKCLRINSESTLGHLLWIEEEILHKLFPVDPERDLLRVAEDLPMIGALVSTQAGIEWGRMRLGLDPWNEERSNTLWAEMVLVHTKLKGEL